jgi:hypothetical protein
MTIAQDLQDDAGVTPEQRRLLVHLLASDERKLLEATARIQGTTQRTRADAVRDALDWAAGAGDPSDPAHDEQGRFWNLQREELVQVSINGVNITTPPPGEEAQLVTVLRTRFMPARRPKLTTPTTESEEYKLVRDWVVDGCPDEPA